MINRLHASHMGIAVCLRRACECIYWLGMNSQLRDFIEQCDTCTSLDSAQSKELLQPHEVKALPWNKVQTDIFHFNDKNYLITVDYFSGFWEIDYLPDLNASTVIHKLKAQFARHGIPRTLLYVRQWPSVFLL
ncbi:hypothetical protein HOLleu_21827 [Holothuria leucospilota]|uniref:Integrase zinc-binding domain-containing protein n=1 Tax=Holothuria leucospilota TaxID=206669 RepID=A0A9Q1BXZ1_HOLLE|nr:hypothetical protein HOLleu_21827 [Holothuria leucospilota]